MFSHLLSVDYSESKDYVVEDLIATRWKPLRGTERALLVRERLDDLLIDVRPFTHQTLFSNLIRCVTDMRPYHLERMLRQFGHVQTIPRQPPTRLTYQLCDKAWAEWQQHIIPLGDVVLTNGPWADTFDYLPWFHNFAYLYVISLNEGQPSHGLVRLPPIQYNHNLGNH